MTSPTGDALLAACVANPDELTVALEYADYLQENGDDARAEFIRVQCERETTPLHHTHPTAVCDCERRCCVLHRRELDLLRRHKAEWRRAGPCPKCVNGYEKHPKTGEVIEQWCRTCFATGDVGGLSVKCGPCQGKGTGFSNASECIFCSGSGWRDPVRFRRGLLDRVEVPRLSDCFVKKIGYRHDPPVLTTETIWRPTPWLRAVVTGHPTVTQVVPLDRVPYPEDRVERVFWSDESVPGDGRSGLPSPVFRALTGFIPASEMKQSVSKVRWYPTREAAVAALGAAVVTVARAGLNKLYSGRATTSEGG